MASANGGSSSLLPEGVSLACSLLCHRGVPYPSLLCGVCVCYHTRSLFSLKKPLNFFFFVLETPHRNDPTSLRAVITSAEAYETVAVQYYTRTPIHFAA